VADQPSVSIVICTRDRAALLRDCLAAVAQVVPPGVEVVVVDSSRTRESVQVTEAHGFRCLRVERPGVSRAKNHGIAESSGEVVLLTDDDCRPQPGWVESMRAAFTDPAVGFALGNVVATEAGHGQSVSMQRTEPARFVSPEHIDDLGHGANLAVRRAAFEQAGLFDELLGPGADLRAAEDVDMYWRLLRAGWQGRLVPESVVLHESWKDMRTMLRDYYGYGFGRGAITVKARALGATIDYPTIPGAVRWIGRSIAKGFEREAFNKLVMTVGQVAGTMKARRYEVVDDVFRSPSDQPSN
jgi:GT2 family glycosyltransferase